MVDLKQYFGNIPSADQAYVKDVYNELLDVMKEELDTYSAGTNQIVKDYVNKLKNEDIIAGTSVTDVVDSGADFERSNLDALKDFLADVKANKNSTLKAVALYEDVENETVVAKYIDALTTMVSEIEEVNDVLKSTSTVNKGLRDITGKLGSLVSAINEYEKNTSDDALYNKYQAAMAAFTQADLTKLTDYVENVYEMFYTLNAVQRSNGKYVVRSEETEYARYLSEDDENGFNANVKTLLTTLVDDSNDETYYQVLTETTSDITKYLKACTTDIEGITLGTTFTSSDAKKIVAAKNAYAELKAVNFAGLTAKEKRAVKANEDSMYVRKEALMSSQIEGTQATLEDILDPLLEENTNRNVADVVNYIKATEFAINRLKELPLCNRLIRETHAVLMSGVRGQEKSPGEFRTSQNWIGGQGSTLNNARYIPPSPSDMNEAMSDLEKYIHSEDPLDPLIRAALIHYQFETIHPFLDGNGRVGRLIITLFLMEQKILSTPALYISYFLKKNRIEYYDRMTEVRTKGDYEQWIKFFLQALIESAEDAIATIEELTILHDMNISSISKMGRISKNALLVFKYLETNPIIDIRKTAETLDITFNTASNVINRLIELGILVQTSTGSRNRTFAYEACLNILRKGT